MEEYPTPQIENTAHGVPSPLLSYVEDEIARLEERLRPISDTGQRKALRFDDYERLAQFREYHQQLLQPQPNYTGIATELQSQQAQYEQELHSLQQKIIPPSQVPGTETMPGDKDFFALQEHILHEQRILVKASAVLDQDDTAYIAWKIEDYKHRQAAGTRRGDVLSDMNKTQARLQRVTSLRQLIHSYPLLMKKLKPL